MAEVEARGAPEFSEHSTAEARAEGGSCQRAGNNVSVAQTPKIRRMDLMGLVPMPFSEHGEHEGRIPAGKAAYQRAHAATRRAHSSKPPHEREVRRNYCSVEVATAGNIPRAAEDQGLARRRTSARDCSAH